MTLIDRLVVSSCCRDGRSNTVLSRDGRRISSLGGPKISEKKIFREVGADLF